MREVDFQYDLGAVASTTVSCWQGDDVGYKVAGSNKSRSKTGRRSRGFPALPVELCFRLKGLVEEGGILPCKYNIIVCGSRGMGLDSFVPTRMPCNSTFSPGIQTSSQYRPLGILTSSPGLSVLAPGGIYPN